LGIGKELLLRLGYLIVLVRDLEEALKDVVDSLRWREFYWQIKLYL